MIWLSLAISVVALCVAIYAQHMVTAELKAHDKIHDEYEKMLERASERGKGVLMSLGALSNRINEVELNQERPANKGAMCPAKKRTMKAGK